MLPSTLDMVPSPSTWNPRLLTLDKKIDSACTLGLFRDCYVIYLDYFPEKQIT